MKKEIFISVSAIFTAINLFGCAGQKSDETSFKTQPKANLYEINLNDLDQKQDERFDENLGHISYLNLAIKQDKSSLLNIDYEANFNGELLKKRFDILNLKSPPITPKEAFWAINVYKNTAQKHYYGINMKPIQNEWFTKLAKNANTGSFGKLSLPAITTANTNIRNLPTDEPIFFNPARAGEGYPFDYLQLSYISVGYPLFISHFSLDGAWAFIGNDNVWGWVRATDVKILKDSEVAALQNSKFIVVTKEKEPIYDTNGKFLFFGRIGTILPVTSENEYKFKGFLYTQSGFSNFEISKQNAKYFPLKFNATNLKNTAGELLGQSYGWGGFGTNRDCSLFLQDYLGQFGIWLPRNSKAQSKIGKQISLKGMDNKSKKELIKNEAVPFLTLFYMPGHIMLYVGFKDDEILLLHDAWGLHTKDNGRAIIGGVAITSAEIGKDVAQIDEKNLLLSKIISMNILKNPPSEPLKNNDKKAQAISEAYNVKIVGNDIIFDNGFAMKFDDGKTKDKNELLNSADVEDMLSENYDFSNTLPPKNNAGRYRNYEFFDQIYGATKSEVMNNLKDVVWLKNSVKKVVKFNGKNGASNALQMVSDELDELLKTRPEMIAFLNNPSGTFNWRIIAGTNRKSAHSYGIAIDINTDKSDYWRWSKDGKYKNQIPSEIVQIFEKYGFIWGGKWKNFDTMHFEYRPELAKFRDK